MVVAPRTPLLINPARIHKYEEGKGAHCGVEGGTRGWLGLVVFNSRLFRVFDLIFLALRSARHSTLSLFSNVARV
jgi:hypothetical protein